jgi:hypothetical protein
MIARIRAPRSRRGIWDSLVFLTALAAFPCCSKTGLGQEGSPALLLGGTIWIDANGNGVRDPGEAGFAGGG